MDRPVVQSVDGHGLDRVDDPPAAHVGGHLEAAPLGHFHRGSHLGRDQPAVEPDCRALRERDRSFRPVKDHLDGGVRRETLHLQPLAGPRSGERAGLRLPAVVDVPFPERQRLGNEQGRGPLLPEHLLKTDTGELPGAVEHQRSESGQSERSTGALNRLGKLEQNSGRSRLAVPRGVCPRDLVRSVLGRNELQAGVHYQRDLVERLAVRVELEFGRDVHPAEGEVVDQRLPQPGLSSAPCELLIGNHAEPRPMLTAQLDSPPDGLIRGGRLPGYDPVLDQGRHAFWHVQQKLGGAAGRQLQRELDPAGLFASAGERPPQPESTSPGDQHREPAVVGKAQHGGPRLSRHPIGL